MDKLDDNAHSIYLLHLEDIRRYIESQGEEA